MAFLISFSQAFASEEKSTNEHISGIRNNITRKLNHAGILTAEEQKFISHIPIRINDEISDIELAYEGDKLVFQLPTHYAEQGRSEAKDDKTSADELTTAKLGNAIGRATLYMRIPGEQAFKVIHANSNTLRGVGLAYEISALNVVTGKTYQFEDYPGSDAPLVHYIIHGEDNPLFTWNSDKRVYMPNTPVFKSWQNKVNQGIAIAREIKDLMEGKLDIPLAQDDHAYESAFSSEAVDILLRHHPVYKSGGAIFVSVLGGIMALLIVYMALASELINLKPIKKAPTSECSAKEIITLQNHVVIDFQQNATSSPIQQTNNREEGEEPMDSPAVLGHFILLLAWSIWVCYQSQMFITLMIPFFYYLSLRSPIPRPNIAGSKKGNKLHFMFFLLSIPLTIYTLKYGMYEGREAYSVIYDTFSDSSLSIHDLFIRSLYMIGLIGITLFMPFIYICYGMANFFHNYILKNK